jgi:hypothetical protein
MTDQSNPKDDRDKAEQKNRASENSRIVDSTQTTPGNKDTDHYTNNSNPHKKPTPAVRLWRAFWRKRLFGFFAGHPKSTFAEKVMASVTIALLFVGIVQAYIYWEQETVMELSLNQNERSIILGRGQLAVAGRSSKAAEESNQINRESLETVQRSYLVFDQINGGKIGTLIPIGTDIWQFTPIWENVGNTPATPVIQDNFTQLLNDEPSEKQFIGTEPEYPMFQIGPHTHIGGIARTIHEPALFEAMVGVPNGKKFISWGWMIYKDVLPKTEPHVTEFCVELKMLGFQVPIELDKSGVPKALPNTPPHFDWQGCKTHNCVDKQCKDYETIVQLLPK